MRLVVCVVRAAGAIACTKASVRPLQRNPPADLEREKLHQFNRLNYQRRVFQPARALPEMEKVLKKTSLSHLTLAEAGGGGSCF
jgi:hypothetical protein